MKATLSAAQEQVWRPYIEASLLLETRLDENLRDRTGLSLIDYHVLMLLSHAPQQRLRMSDLADRLVFSRSRISYQITSMSKRGLVLREPAPEDGRGYRAVLTATGADILRSAAPIHAEPVRDLFFGCIRDDEMPYIERVFSRLDQHLRTTGTTA